MRKMLRALLLTMLSAGLLMGTASAHTLWLNFTDYTPSLNEKQVAKSKLYIGWGHHFPLDGFVEAKDFDSIRLFSPKGDVQAVALSTTGFAASEVELKEEGIYLAEITRRVAFNTQYKDKGETKTLKGTKEGLHNVISSTFSQQFAKALIQVNGGREGDISKRLGHTLELVPLTNPYELVNNTGGLMKVQVFYKGKPLPFARVTAMYEGFSADDGGAAYAPADKNGIATLRITHWGTWVVKTAKEDMATGDLATKVNDEKYYTSLTFYVP